MLKQPNICLPGNNSTLQSTSTHETSFLSWATAQKVYNLLPLGIASCESIYEAKMYTVALLAMKKNIINACSSKKNAYVCSATFLYFLTCGFFVSVLYCCIKDIRAEVLIHFVPQGQYGIVANREASASFLYQIN